MGKSTGRQPAHRAAIDPAPEASLALAVHVLGGMEFGRQVASTDAWRWRRFDLMRCRSGVSMPPCCAESKRHPCMFLRRACGPAGLRRNTSALHRAPKIWATHQPINPSTHQPISASPHHLITEPAPSKFCEPFSTSITTCCQPPAKSNAARTARPERTCLACRVIR